jgi:hypothetical protein
MVSAELRRMRLKNVLIAQILTWKIKRGFCLGKSCKTNFIPGDGELLYVDTEFSIFQDFVTFEK